MQAQDKNDVTTVTIKVRGNDVTHRIHKKFFDSGGEINKDILVTLRNIHREIQEIEERQIEEEPGENNPAKKANRCFEADIAAMAEIRHEWERKLPRLYYLLKILEDGTFSFRCTLVACPHHSEKGGLCPCNEDLTQLIMHSPEMVGCATGRVELGIDRRRYGSPRPSPRVVVSRRHPPKKRVAPKTK